MVSNGIQKAFTRGTGALQCTVEGENEGHEDYKQRRRQEEACERRKIGPGERKVINNEHFQRLQVDGASLLGARH